MKNFTELLMEEGFSEGFTPEETQGRFKDFHDPQLGKGGYTYEEIPHTLGVIKKFVYKIWSQMERYKTIIQYPEKFGKKDEKEWKTKFEKDAYKIIEAIEAKHGRAALDAEELIKNSKAPTRPPAYLQSKKLSDLSGYLVDAGNAEVIHLPLYGRDGKLCSVQTIFPDGSKGFLPGGRIQGSFGYIEGDSEILYICEGFATALSIRAATGKRVAYVLSAENYIEGLASILAKFKNPIRVVACDDDKHLKDNIGFNKAFTAAARYNCLVKKPTFIEYKEKETTDFDDLRREASLEEVKKQLEVTAEEREAITVNEGLFPLGHSDSIYYFTSTANASVQAFSTLNKDNLFKLMPEEWWMNRYSEPGLKGEPIVKWESITSKLYAQCHAIGKYRDDLIRGVGVYLDEGRSVVHLGEKLLVDGVEHPLRGFHSKYTYLFDHKIKDISPIEATDSESAILYQLLSNLTLQEESAKLHLAGWIVCAILSGSLSWKPHLYVTGEKGAGKSTILSFIQKILSSGFTTHFMNAVGSSATGLRQRVGSSCTSVIIDEIESDSKKMSAAIEGIVTLFRVASSNSDAMSVLGTPGQKSIQTRVSFCGLLGGIVKQIKTDQDKSRFAVIEFKKEKDPSIQSKQWETVRGLITFCQSDEYASKFAARIIRNSKVIVGNIEKLTYELMKIDEARLAQQYGALLAASLALKHVRPISDEEIENFKKLLITKDSSIEMSSEATGVTDLLEQILSADLFDEENKRTTPLRELSKREQTPKTREILGEYGVVITEYKGKQGIQIRDTVKIRKQIQDLSMFVNDYVSSLTRIPGAAKSMQVRFQGRRYRGVWLPMDAIVELPPDTIDKSEQF